MTVKNFIERLSLLPQDSTIVIRSTFLDDEDNWGDVFLEEIEGATQTDDGYVYLEMC